MAGGINLPTSGVGASPIQPIMNFDPVAQDPFTTAIMAYQRMKEGQGQGLANVKLNKELPFVEGQQRSQIAQALAAAAANNAQAEQQRTETGVYKQTIPTLLEEAKLNREIAANTREKKLYTPEQKKIYGLMQSKEFIAALRKERQAQRQGGAQGQPAPSQPGIGIQGTPGMGAPMQQPSPFAAPQGRDDDLDQMDALIDQEFMTEADKAGTKAHAEQSAKEDEKYLGERRKELQHQAKQASALISALDTGFNAMKKTSWWQKGPGGGKVPSITSEAQIVEKANADLESAMTRAVQQGHMNQSDFMTISKKLTRRDLTDKAYTDVYSILRASERRNQEEALFFDAAKKQHWSPDEMAEVWDYYSVNYPPIVDGKPALQNQNKWRELMRGQVPEPQKSVNEPLIGAVANTLPLNESDQPLMEKARHYTPEEIRIIANGGRL